MKKILLISLFIVMTATILTGCAEKIGTAKDGNEVSIEAAAIKLANGAKEAGYGLVDTATLKSWVDEKKDMIIIDTMPADSYAKGRIPGALNAELPKTGLKDATAEQKAAFEKLLGSDKNKLIVVYCGFTACGRSHAGATYAKQLGYTNVYRYPGGIIGWRDAKYPEEK